MKKLVVLICLLVVGTVSLAQNQNVVYSLQLKPKQDKIAEFEKRLPLLLKTHWPQLSFRVYECLTGPNTGSFYVVTGPFAFKDLDLPMASPKGDAAQKADVLALEAICDHSEVSYWRYVDEANIPNPGRDIKYVMVTKRELIPGSWGTQLAFLKKLKEARMKNNTKNDIAYTRPVASGEMNTFAAIRFISSYADLDYSEPVEEWYDGINGRASYDRDVRGLNSILKSAVSELRVLRKDLSAQAAAK